MDNRKRFFKVITACLLCCAMLLPGSMLSVNVQAASKVGKAAISKITTLSTGNPKITWKEVSGATAYRVYRKTTSDTKYTKIATTSKLSYTDKKWTGKAGEQISYKVRAYVKKDGKKTYGSYSTVKKWTVPGKDAKDTANSGTNAYPAPVFGKLKVTGTKITDTAGNIVQLKGVSSHGLQWFPEFVNYDALLSMRDDWGINIFRLALYSSEGGYCEQDAAGRAKLKELVTQTVEDCRKLGIYVIIDWHVLGERDPNIYKEEAKIFFAEMAEKYADCDNVIYEICNEPNGEDVDWPKVKRYAEEIIPIIRKYDNDAIIVVGTPNWSQFVIDAAENPITGYDNLMYTLHFYAGSHGEWLQQSLIDAIEMFNLPIFVTEYGIGEAAEHGRIDYNAAEIWRGLLDKYSISSCVWALSNKDELNALLKSTTTKTSGWTTDDLSDAGRWFIEKMMGKQKGK